MWINIISNNKRKKIKVQKKNNIYNSEVTFCLNAVRKSH
jgi:hypothetical protein